MAVAGAKLNAPTEIMFTTAACGLAFRCGSAACTRNTGPRRFTSCDFANASARHLAQRLGQGVGGVVHHDVDAAELVDRALHQSFEIVDVAEVSGHPDGLAAEFAQVLRGLLAGVGFAAGDDDAGTREDEPLRKCQPDSPGPARHDDGAVGHVEQTVK